MIFIECFMQIHLHYRIDNSTDQIKFEYPGNLIPELRLVWTTGIDGVKVQNKPTE